MGVRDWPWWRLLVRVTPLLNVHRTEEELRTTKVRPFIFYLSVDLVVNSFANFLPLFMHFFLFFIYYGTENQVHM